MSTPSKKESKAKYHEGMVGDFAYSVPLLSDNHAESGLRPIYVHGTTC